MMNDGQSSEWATVTTNNAASDQNSAWTAALTGIALGVFVDRTMNAPQHIGGSDGYGINPDGSVYRMGQLAPGAQMPVQRRGGDMLLLMLVGWVVLMHGAK